MKLDLKKIDFEKLSIGEARRLAYDYIKEANIKNNFLSGHIIRMTDGSALTFTVSHIDGGGLYFTSIPSSTWRDIYLLDFVLQTGVYSEHICCKKDIYIKLEEMLHSVK